MAFAEKNDAVRGFRRGAFGNPEKSSDDTVVRRNRPDEWPPGHTRVLNQQPK